MVYFPHSQGKLRCLVCINICDRVFLYMCITTQLEDTLPKRIFLPCTLIFQVLTMTEGILLLMYVLMWLYNFSMTEHLWYICYRMFSWVHFVKTILALPSRYRSTLIVMCPYTILVCFFYGTPCNQSMLLLPTFPQCSGHSQNYQPRPVSCVDSLLCPEHVSQQTCYPHNSVGLMAHSSPNLSTHIIVRCLHHAHLHIHTNLRPIY